VPPNTVIVDAAEDEHKDAEEEVEAVKKVVGVESHDVAVSDKSNNAKEK
jgi:hypothetical protein